VTDAHSITARGESAGRRYALVAGGGTAGHLQPALAIAEALVDRGHPRGSIEFIGSERGQDADALAGRGFPSTLLPGRGIVRSLAPRNLVRNVRSAAELCVAAGRAVRVVGRARPRVVVAVGGYASLAGAVGAVLHRVPLVLVNVDAVPGAANRLLGRFARASAVGWEGTPLPRAVVTGTPVRPAIARVDRSAAGRAAARTGLGLPPERSVVVVFGGSLGARQVNRAADGMVDRWADRPDRSIYHIVGRRDWSAYEPDPAVERLPADGVGDGHGGPGRPDGVAVVRVAYEDRMAEVYAAADLVVCRAGAMTVAELAAAGVPAVLVPLPGAPGDHQTANASVLERVGAAVLLPDPACTPEGLAGIVDGLLADPDRLAAMGRAAAAMGRPDAAAAGARVVEESARPGDPADDLPGSST
jgi:UDP-N-acetylglucosamine--N-acetylmuramyl-(pentapeptide) pyrophosphoryl-undecaprenol N-acetylglucosamine transferase